MKDRDSNGNVQGKISDLFAPSCSGLKKRSQSLPPRPKAKQDLSDLMLSIWIGSSSLPINIVDDENMLLWLKTFDPQATLPGRDKMRRLVNELADKIRAYIMERLEKSRRVNVSSDIWTSDDCVTSYIGITVHFLNPNTNKRENYRICCREFPEVMRDNVSFHVCDRSVATYTKYCVC